MSIGLVKTIVTQRVVNPKAIENDPEIIDPRLFEIDGFAKRTAERV